ILVHPRDFDRSQSLLINQGFRIIREHGWEVELKDSSGRVAVDLHRGITPEEFRPPIRFEDLWQRVQTISLAQSVTRTLCPEDTLLMLSMQITKDRFPSLAKIGDIAQFVHAYKHLDWSRLLRHSRRQGGQRIILFGLCMANELLSAPLPPEVMREARRHPSI